VKRPAWGVYDIFETAAGAGCSSCRTDTQWEWFCAAFNEESLGQGSPVEDERMRVKERSWLSRASTNPEEAFGRRAGEEAGSDRHAVRGRLPSRWDLLDGSAPSRRGGLLETRYNGKALAYSALPIELDGKRLTKRSDPRRFGQDGRELLRELGYYKKKIAALVRP